MKFLRLNTLLQQEHKEPIPAKNENQNAGMTIKDAVIRVLKVERRAMTADEIYSEIIKKNLYTFGAQNPVNVVRTTIEYACDNSGYSNKDVISYFRIEKNNEGKRIYSLLDTATLVVDTAQLAAIEDIATKKNRKTLVFDERIEREFRKWLKQEDYSQKTADAYCRAVEKIFRNYSLLARKVVNDSASELESIQKYMACLNEDINFREQNISSHYQLTAALAAFKRFCTFGYIDVESGSDNLISEQTFVKNTSDSFLDNIIDLHFRCF